MIRLGDSAPVPSKITFLSPLTSISTQTVTARAVLDNDGGRFRPGMFVTADVLTAVVPVAVAIKQEAIQEIDGKRVVFLRKGDGEFVVREVELGERDQRMVEVLFGVVAGDTYVTQNSFVLKAELGKAAAEHAH
jgi:cobalt-zinc-cadmium efflux system membrane fusion protein